MDHRPVITLYEYPEFQGKKVPLNISVEESDLNEFVGKSAHIERGTWIINPNEHDKKTITAPFFLQSFSSVIRSVELVTQQIILYENTDYLGDHLTLTESANDLRELNFPGASSIRVISGQWELFSRKQYRGTSVIVEPGRKYRTLANVEGQEFGHDILSSVRLQIPEQIIPSNL